MTCVRIVCGSLAAVIVFSGSLVAQDAPEPNRTPAKSEAEAKSSKPKAKTPRRGRNGGPRTYMGRPIAPVMSYEGGADWLVRPERENEEQPDAMLDALKIKPGATVADVGAGVGYTSIRIARRVGPEGRVLATDVQPEMLRMLARNAKSAGFKNIRPIRCTFAESGLPDGEVDLAIMVDVYHECPDPEVTLQGLRKALKPGGRLVLVEFRAEDPNVPIRPEHKMTFAQVRREVEPQGFKFKEKLDFLPWQHIIIFERPADVERSGDVKKKSAAKD